MGLRAERSGHTSQRKSWLAKRGESSECGSHVRWRSKFRIDASTQVQREENSCKLPSRRGYWSCRCSINRDERGARLCRRRPRGAMRRRPITGASSSPPRMLLYQPSAIFLLFPPTCARHVEMCEALLKSLPVPSAARLARHAQGPYDDWLQADAQPCRQPWTASHGSATPMPSNQA